MLSRVSTCRTSQYHRPLNFLRSNSTSTTRHEPRPSIDTVSQEPRTRRKEQTNAFKFGDRYPSTRTAHIRFWEPVHNVADVWVVKRALEKKYGTILETYFLKDFESPDRYQMLAFIIFRDLESLKRIPEAGEEFTVLAPETPQKPIHEISMKNIEAYAGSDEFQPGFQFSRPEPDTQKRIIGGNIKQSSTEFCSNPDYRRLFQSTSQKTMSYFLNWGGFSDAKLDTSQTVTESDLFQPDAMQKNARMRAALQLASRITSSPIPQGISTDATEGQKASKGPSLETARIFAGLYDTMPGPALGRLKREEVDEDLGEGVPSSSSADTTTAIPNIDPLSHTQELAVEGEAPRPVGDSTPLKSQIPVRQPIKRPTMAPEEKRKLESQLHAAKLLQQAVTPVRRKQLKPVTVEREQKPPRIREQKDTPFIEEKQEKTGFLAKLSSLFGR